MNTQRCNRCIRHGVSCTLLREPTAVRCARCASNGKRCLFANEYRNRVVATTATASWADRGAKIITNPISSYAGTDSNTASKTRLFIRIPPRRVLTTVASVQQESAEPVVVCLFWSFALAVIQPPFLQNPSVQQRKRVSVEIEHRVNLRAVCWYS